MDTRRLKRYLKQNLLALDQLANTLLCGWADETISSRCYRRAVVEPAEQNQSAKLKWRVLMTLINALFFDKQHCRASYLSEVERSQLPQSLRRENGTD